MGTCMDEKAGSGRFDFRAFYRFFVPSLGQESRKGYVLGFCHFHEDHKASLSVNMNNGFWHCVTGCGEGDVFSFYKRLKGVDLETARRGVAKIAKGLKT